MFFYFVAVFAVKMLLIVMSLFECRHYWQHRCHALDTVTLHLKLSFCFCYWHVKAITIVTTKVDVVRLLSSLKYHCHIKAIKLEWGQKTQTTMGALIFVTRRDFAAIFKFSTCIWTGHIGRTWFLCLHVSLAVLFHKINSVWALKQSKLDLVVLFTRIFCFTKECFSCG